MAPGICFYCSPYQNSLIVPAHDDPTHAPLKASTKSNSPPIPTSWTFSPISGLFSACIALSADEDLFKQVMQAYLAAQTIALIAAPGLAQNPDAGP